MTDYKLAKEAFVSDQTGSTLTHINLISLTALLSIALYSALQSRLPPTKSIHFLAECLLLILPLLLSVTTFAGSPLALSFLELFPTALLLLIPPRDSTIPLPSSNPASPTRRNNVPIPNDGSSVKIEPLPALTTYRAHMILLTAICILAVDFPAFPRFLAKCETFGVSLMDMGVGAFVFSQGIVSAIPLLKDPAYLTASMSRKVPQVIRKMFPILLLGLIRVFLVKGTEYPEHESEYGAHWNFFITLAIVPVLQVLLHPIILHVPISLIGLIVAISYQIALSSLGLQDFVLSTPRTNLWSANKEGIASIAGYLAIHLLGLSTGTFLLPPSPSYFRRRQKAYVEAIARQRDSNPQPSLNNNAISQRQDDKTATELCSYAVVWWVLVGLSKLAGLGTDVSRRLANLPYILWVAAYNTSLILGYQVIDLYFFPSPLSRSIYSPISKLKVPLESPGFPLKPQSVRQHPGSPPPLLEAINKNGLVLFLLANLVTGIVNLSIRTMYTPDLWAMLILGGYSFGLCCFAWIFRFKRLWNH